MNVFQRLERALQRAVERPFTRLTRARLQPVEVARVLEKELVANRRVGVDRVYAPNWFRAELSTPDFVQFEPFLRKLEQEIAADLIRQAQRRRYDFVGDVTVELAANAELRPGDILALAEIRATEEDLPHAPDAGGRLARTSVIPAVSAPAPLAPTDDVPTLLVRDEHGAEQRVHMAGAVLRIGRGLENDVVLDSLSVSRNHARLLRDGGLTVEDLGSRNGTFVNGRRVQRAQVGPGDRIRLGATEVQIER